ncbi:hypothetical protein ACFL1X_00630 [Candidatus Hydrogenedentota bacterium]
MAGKPKNRRKTSQGIRVNHWRTVFAATALLPFLLIGVGIVREINLERRLDGQRMILRSRIQKLKEENDRLKLDEQELVKARELRKRAEKMGLVPADSSSIRLI